MQDKFWKMGRIAAMLGLLSLCAGSAWAQFPWQVGDVVVCYGAGTCNVLRIVGSAPGTPNFLNALNDGLSGATNGTAINNTLHLLVTDGGAGQSNVVQYSIASINPFSGATVPHSTTIFPGSSNANSDNAQAIAVDSKGDMFVGNAGSGDTPVASIVELDAHGAAVAGQVFPFPTSTDPCATTNLGSLDLSTAGDAIYVTAGDGKIRKVTLPLSTGNCTVFADFGSGVTLFGIKDVPAGALVDNCPSGGCPSGEALLVAAKGFVDIDTGETEPGGTDPDAVNVCTNSTGGSAQSCALLLNTAASTPSLTGPVWAASQLYGTNGTTILDAFLHVEKVVSPGTSGSDEPAWSQTGGTVLDNAVIWTNQGQKLWLATHLFSSGNLVVDPAGHVQKVTIAGTSAATEPSPWNDSSPPPSFGGITKDGLKWADQGSFAWQMNHSYVVPASSTDPSGIVVDAHGHIQRVTTPGTSGTGAPAFTSNIPSTGRTLDGLTWTNMGARRGTPPPPWTPNTLYPTVGAQVLDSNNKVEQVATTGTSGAGTAPAGGWNPSLNGTTIDNAVIWTDQGPWLPHHTYIVGDTAGDTNSHLWQVTIGGMSDASTIPAFTANDLPTGTGVVYENNAVTWTDQGAWQPNHAYTQGAQVGDTNRYLWQETNTKGKSGPALPAFTSHDSMSTTVTDGLQWQDQSTSPSVVARYPIGSQTGLQALALDPLVADCTSTCSSLPLPDRKLANFWLADSGSGNIFQVKFADGNFNTYDTNAATGCPVGGCGVDLHSIVIYGGEGGNQPGLASLVLSSPTNDLQSSNSFTAKATILNNTITSTLYGTSLPLSTPISLYTSLVDKTSCFSDSPWINGVNVSVVGSLPCQATVQADTTKALVWKIDIPKGQAAALPALPPVTETLNTAFTPPTGTFDNSTDVFVDEQYDDTTFVGTDPGTRTLSVHSLHEVPNTSQTQAQCTFSSPLQNGCYKTNRNTLNFIFTCPGLSQTQFQDMHPVLSLVKKNLGQSPQFIPVAGTNGKGPFRFDSASNFWTFQWNLNGAMAGEYEGTASDSPGPGDNPPVQSFTVFPFFLKKSCP